MFPGFKLTGSRPVIIIDFWRFFRFKLGTLSRLVVVVVFPRLGYVTLKFLHGGGPFCVIPSFMAILEVNGGARFSRTP